MNLDIINHREATKQNMMQQFIEHCRTICTESAVYFITALVLKCYCIF